MFISLLSLPHSNACSRPQVDILHKAYFPSSSALTIVSSPSRKPQHFPDPRSMRLLPEHRRVPGCLFPGVGRHSVRIGLSSFPDGFPRTNPVHRSGLWRMFRASEFGYCDPPPPDSRKTLRYKQVYGGRCIVASVCVCAAACDETVVPERAVRVGSSSMQMCREDSHCP